MALLQRKSPRLKIAVRWLRANHRYLQLDCPLPAKGQDGPSSVLPQT